MMSLPLLSMVIETQEPSTAASEDLISSTLKPGNTVRLSAGVATLAAAWREGGRINAAANRASFGNRAKNFVFISRMMRSVFVIRSRGASLLWGAGNRLKAGHQAITQIVRLPGALRSSPTWAN